MNLAKNLANTAKPLTILYVEDHEKTRNDNDTLLSKFFGTVISAEDGEEAFSYYQKYKPDIILTDINMPNMNGIELIKAVFDINPKQPIAVISAHSESNYLLELINLGIEKFLLKPIDLEKLLLLLNEMVNRILDQKDVLEYQDALELENLESNVLIYQLMKKNEELEKTLQDLRNEENVNTTLIKGIKEDKKFSSRELDSMSVKHNKVNSSEFITNYAGDFASLNGNLEEVEESLELQINSLNDLAKKSHEKLANDLMLYSYFLKNTFEFPNLTAALEKLAKCLSEVKNLSYINGVEDFLFGISDALQKWRIKVMVEQNADDIHFMDESIISDCSQTQQLVLGELDVNDGNIDLF